MTSNRPYVFVVPTYAWQIPHIVRDWILHTEFEQKQKVYFVMTCGDSIGNAKHYGANLCKKKDLIYMGCTDIIMPENYIAMYEVPNEKAAKEIVKKAEHKIKETADLIKSEERLLDQNISFGGKISSSLVNTLFYGCIVSAKKFYATNSCVSCSFCVKVCPLENIKMVDGKPSWGKNCTHCMACICTCPKEAIEYGKKSQGKPRYTCQK
jgi:NAD-dependent dihydropyrimidine dehydrogenase PreA subunit